MLMTLGMFVFQLPTLAYQDFQRQTSWRHPSQSRVGAPSTSQFLGRGDDTITLTGVLMTEISGGVEPLDTVRVMADKGEAWPLVEGTGVIYGLYVIEDLTEGRTLFFSDGAARRIDFTLSLKRVDDDQVDLLGNLITPDQGFLS
ncbi:MAG: phage tail protein [Pseudomonas sp.]|uniref:phage tail protein n=1 Tax=Pseudomonas sp. TaxID=306 RepID=UPI0033907D9C